MVAAVHLSTPASHRLIGVGIRGLAVGLRRHLFLGSLSERCWSVLSVRTVCAASPPSTHDLSGDFQPVSPQELPPPTASLDNHSFPAKNTKIFIPPLLGLPETATFAEINPTVVHRLQVF